MPELPWLIVLFLTCYGFVLLTIRAVKYLSCRRVFIVAPDRNFENLPKPFSYRPVNSVGYRYELLKLLDFQIARQLLWKRSEESVKDSKFIILIEPCEIMTIPNNDGGVVLLMSAVEAESLYALVGCHSNLGLAPQEITKIKERLKKEIWKDEIAK